MTFANHLWQSTLFAAAAALLTLALKRNPARTRYWLWLAASWKFLLPFSFLVGLGSHLGWRPAPTIPHAPLAFAVEEITRPFARAPQPAVRHLATAPVSFSALLAILWLCGLLAVLFSWYRRWRRLATIVRTARPLPEGRETRILRELEHLAGIRLPLALAASSTSLEPGIFGIFRPILLLPAGILHHLDDAQLRAILAHELCHVRRRDNLAAALHMLVEAVFWFHPLVWWLGARLVEERERACDEEVLHLGSDPETYAQGILQVVRYCLESPLACVSGITGAALKKRIHDIVAPRAIQNLNRKRRALLAATGIAALAGPIAIGIWNAPPTRAQTETEPNEKPVFEVASIKPSGPDEHRIMIQFAPGGRLQTINTNLKALIRLAYSVQDFQISGLPGALDSIRYDVSAKPDHPIGDDLHKATEEQRKKFQQDVMLRIQALLADRFQLRFHRETKDLPIYALLVAKNGPKLEESKPADNDKFHGMRLTGQGHIEANAIELEMLCRHLSMELGRSVQDQTGLKGNYNFKLEYTPDSGQPSPFGVPQPHEAPPAETSGPSLFTALQEQLGLKLESRKGPVEILVIDHAEKASEN